MTHIACVVLRHNVADLYSSEVQLRVRWHCNSQYVDRTSA